MNNSVLFLGLRHLRGPLILMVSVFAVGIGGLVLIPGVDAQDQRWHLTFAQALYFMSYTATTIGFGEVPGAFTDTQRLWVTAMIFASVVAWATLVGSLLGLLRHQAFRGALTLASFTRSIRAMREPFYLICGFGETGLLIGRALDRLGIRFVVIDTDPLRVEELALLDLVQDVPRLCADARLPEYLLQAGLARPTCRGVLALTGDEQTNLAVAMSVRLLNPDTPVLARAMSTEVAGNMASFGTDHIINPFSRFGAYLALALAAPANYQLITWLTALTGTDFAPPAAPPRGHWVICGYGRFGREAARALRGQDLDVSVIDPGDQVIEGIRTIRGTGTEAAPLLAAGIGDAVGIVVGTDDDITNLSIAVTARELNGSLFTVVRQNLQANSALFRAFRADITMISSAVIANDCLAVIQTPQLADFVTCVSEQKEPWAQAALARVAAVLGSRVPEIWSVTINTGAAPALTRRIAEGLTVTLGDLARSPADRLRPLPLLPLALTRGGQLRAFPDPDLAVASGDQVLYAGTPEARATQARLLRNPPLLDYAVTGVEAPAAWIWQQLLGQNRSKG
jgi:voltage-gated potassium channel